MQRLTVLLAASDPALRGAIGQILLTRNYRVVQAHLDDQLSGAVARDPHDIAIIAPDGAEASLARARAYREASRSTGVRTVLISDGLPPALAKELGDHVVALRGAADGTLDREALLEALDQATRHLVAILVVDDEPMIRRMFSTFLKKEGYRVDTAEDGINAVRKIQETPPDLVITDIQMPNLDGYGVCRAIKESRDTQHIPVIIVSALGGEVDIDKGFNAGANEYVTKPVEMTELSGRIQNIFRGIAMRGREKVLVVTASQIELSLLEYGLNQQGFEVIAAHDGDRAYELTLSERPSVIVSDIQIPGLELPDLRARLRESARGTELPLVVLSPAATKLDRKTREILKAASYITKPFPMERLMVAIERILGERRSNLEVEREILLQMIRSLVTTLEARDSYTRGHSENVARYTGMMARRMFVGDEAEVKRLVLSAQLHDIGKIGVPDAILLKPGKLTDEEWEIMKTHPGRGSEILEPILSLREILPGVRWHHERIDGRGYPDKLKGMDIPLMARIIGVADTFDALTNDRPYRKGCPLEKAIAILNDAAGSQLDPEIVALFCDILAADPDPLRKGLKAEGTRAAAAAQPAPQPTQPVTT